MQCSDKPRIGEPVNRGTSPISASSHDVRISHRGAKGTLEKPIRTWMKCSSSVSTSRIARSRIIAIDVRSVKEMRGLS